MGALALWERRLAEVERCKADEETFHSEVVTEAYAEHDRELDRLASIYGSSEQTRANPIGAKAWNEAYDAMRSQEDAYGIKVSATDNAVEALMVTAPPDFTALIRKIQLIEERELWGNSGLVMHPVAAIRQDIEALSA